MIVFAPAIGWMYWQGDTAWATALLVWAVPVTALDGVLRPYLIRMGADLPLMLILPGVIGGLIAFGVLGLFVGPVLLAVGYTLLTAWLAEGETHVDEPGRRGRAPHRDGGRGDRGHRPLTQSEGHG